MPQVSIILGASIMQQHVPFHAMEVFHLDEWPLRLMSYVEVFAFLSEDRTTCSMLCIVSLVSTCQGGFVFSAHHELHRQGITERLVNDLSIEYQDELGL